MRIRARSWFRSAVAGLAVRDRVHFHPQVHLRTLQQIKTPWLGLVYVLPFRLGSIASMGVLSAVVSVSMRLSADRLTQGHVALNVAAGLFSVGLGLDVVGAQLT